MSQGAGDQMDKVGVQDKPIAEWFAAFYSWASADLNAKVAMGRDVMTAKRAGDLRAQLPSLAARMMLRFVIPVVLEEGFRHWATGAGPDDDKKATPETYYMMQAVRSWAFGVPVLRDLLTAVGPGGRDYEATPITDIGKSTVDTLALARHYINGERVDPHRAAIKVAKSASYATGLPLAYPVRQADYLLRVWDGKEKPANMVQFARELLAAKQPHSH
jgi:hypothetical protein